MHENRTSVAIASPPLHLRAQEHQQNNHTSIPMKKILTLLALLTCSIAVHAKTVTLGINTQPAVGDTCTAAQTAVATNETAQITSAYGFSPTLSSSSLLIIKDAITNGITLAQGSAGAFTPPVITVAGPALIQLKAPPPGGTATWFVTVRIEPESFPADKTLIIPQGTPGANVVMEQSTDLITWSPSQPGLYTNTATSHLFFRIRADRL